MRVFYGFERTDAIRRPVVTIGSYDGVHRGHRTILARINALAAERGGESVVVTFHPHPRTIVGGEPVMLLSTLPEKLSLLESVGVGATVVVPFDKAFSRRSPRDFVCNDLVGKLHMDALLVGYNHHLGHNKEGDYESLSALSAECGFALERMPCQQVGESKVSSTAIRRMILSGDVYRAADYLDAPYFICARLEGDGALSGVEPVKLLPPAGEYPVFCRPKEFSEAGFAARLAVSADRRLRLDRTDGVPASAAVAIEFR